MQCTNVSEEQLKEASPAIVIAIPILLVEAVLTIGSNVILLLLLARAYKGTTSLNILLLSISGFNLMAVFNQVVLTVQTSNETLLLGPRLCNFVLLTQTMYMFGTTMVHFLISRDRYNASKDPYSWQSNKKQALSYSATVWIAVLIIAVLNTILHANDITGDYTTCFWPIARASDCAKGYKLTIKVANLIGVLILSALTFANYFKTLRELFRNEKKKLHALKESSIILQRKHIMTSSEKTALSLLIIFIIHLTLQIPSYIYDVVRFGIARYNNDGGDRGAETHSNPLRVLLIILTTMGLAAYCLPIVLMVINNRFKYNVLAMLRCKWDVAATASSDSEKQQRATGLKVTTPSIQPPKLLPDDPNVFFAKTSAKYFPDATESVSVTITEGTANNSSSSTQGLVLGKKTSNMVMSNNFIFNCK